MNFIQHPSNNRVLSAPPGVPIDECRALPITDTEMNGQPAVASFWLPDAVELLALQAGQPVVLFVSGYTHPPISLGVAK